MAKLSLNNPLNTPGPLFVDTTCIDCGTCFHIGPDIFKEETDSSIVLNQPLSQEDWNQAKAAIVSCPTNSIGVHDAPLEFKRAEDGLPYLVAQDVYYCGYTSRDSFGATSYLILREQGNILIDSPRFHPHLIKKLEELGGVKLMYLSHQDDVADHALFAGHFKCQRIIHRLEVSSSTEDCEMILEGEGDWDLAGDVKILFTPGHTEGHLSLLYKNNFLFTGDHLFYSAESDKVYASSSVNWFSWPLQQDSLRKLLSFQFNWVLPGHGGWVQKDPGQFHKEISDILK